MTIDTVVPQTSLRQEAQHNPLAQLWTLVRVNIYLAWRRVMSKVLLGILVGLFALIVGFITLAYVTTNSAPLNSQRECPPNATQCQEPSQAELEQQRQQTLDAIRATVTFPTSLAVAGGFTGFVGALLIAILGGTLVGSEYGLGTLRLSLSRGLARAHLLFGQILSLAVIALAVGIGMLLLGALVGVTIGPALGATLPDLTAEGARELVFYGLALSLQVFVYALFALFFATLGRSAAAGVGASIGLLFLENVASPIFRAIGGLISGDWGGRLEHTPDWFPYNNVGSLVTRVSNAPIALNQPDPITLDLTHAALVIAAYVVLLIAGSYALFRTRDMTD